MYLWTSPSSPQTWGAAFVFLPKYGNGITVATVVVSVVEFSLGMSKPPRDFSFGGFFFEVGGGRFVHFRLMALAYHIGGSLMSSMWGVFTLLG